MRLRDASGVLLLGIATVCGPADGRTIAYVKIVDTETVIAFTDPFTAMSAPSIRGGHVAFTGVDFSKPAKAPRVPVIGPATAKPVGPGDFYSAVMHSNAISFTKLADTDTALPDGGGQFSSFGPPSFDELFGVFTGTGGREAGIYLGCCGPAPAPLALVGDPVAGGLTYAAFIAAAIDRDTAAEVNWVAFLALTTPGFGQGIYLLGPQPGLVADSGTMIPGVNESFVGFSKPDIDEGTLAFRGHGASGHAGVFKRTVTDPELIIVADVNTDIPGGNGTFIGFGAPSVFNVLSTRDGDVAFVGNGSVFQKGVYAEIDGVLGVIADKNTRPPAAPGSFFDFPDTAPSISDGNVAFVSVNNIFQSYLNVRFEGELLRIIGAGDPLDGKTVNGAEIGPESLDGNLLAFKVFFDDGSVAIYVAILGELPPPSDIDEDGDIGIVDFMLVLDEWGPCDDCDDCPADVDGDCQVGIIDLLFVLATWGPLDVGPPVNDQCLTATTIIGGAYLFSTVGATTSDVFLPSGIEPGWPSFFGVDCDEGAGYAFENDIWFRFVVPSQSGILTVLTCDIVDFDSRLALYRRNPGTPSICDLFEGIICNDDAPFCDFGSLMSIRVGSFFDSSYSVDFGDELFIRVGSRDPAISGSGTLVVTMVPIENSDLKVLGEEPYICEEFFLAPDGGFRVFVDFNGHTGVIDDTPDCGGLDVVDHWYCFVSPWTGATGVVSETSSISVAVFDHYGTMLACSTDPVTSWGAVSGQTYYIRFGTADVPTPPFMIAWVNRLDDDACGWPFAGPCFISNPGIPGCVQGNCCILVCGNDPYCCHIEWDGICATEANMLCDPSPGPACADPSLQSCYMPSSDPSCEDPACCEVVCQTDPFCCDFAWDVQCILAAIALCDPPLCGQFEDQSCCESSLFPGCNEPACCGVICEILPFCCTVEWNQQCADLAVGVCVTCQ